MPRSTLRSLHLPLLAVAVLCAVLFAWLGAWQLDRAQLLGQRSVPDPVPLAQAWAPRTSVSDAVAQAPVVARGTFDASRQVRVLGGAETAGTSEADDWVLTPLVVATAEGEAVLPVVRGSVRAGVELPAPPRGEVVVTGWVMRNEPPAPARASVPDDAMVTVSGAELARRWPDTVQFAGYLLLTGSEPDSDLVKVPRPTGGASWAIQNLFYALQWWIFAVFGVYLWWRVVAADRAERRHGTHRQSSSDHGAPSPR